MIFATLVILSIQVFYFPVRCNSDVEWIDPFKLESLQSEKHVCGAQSDAMAYYKRAINLILVSVIRENSDVDIYNGRLFIDIPLEDYIYLKKFANEETEEPLGLKRVDEILAKILTKSKIKELTDVLIYWSDYLYFIAFNRATGVYLTLLMVVIVIYKLLKASYTPYQVTKYLFFLGYLIDFAFTWKRLMQELEINKYADSMKYDKLPADCQLSKISAWQFLLYFISGADNCREYHKIILYDVFWDVGPLDVIAHQTRIILNVASNIGIALSKLTSGLISGLPFPLNIILLPILLVFLLFLVWSLITYLTDTHIDVNLFHIIYVKFRTNKSIKNKSKDRPKKFRKEVEEIEPPKVEKKKVLNKKKKEKNEEPLILKKQIVESIPMP